MPSSGGFSGSVDQLTTIGPLPVCSTALSDLYRRSSLDCAAIIWWLRSRVIVASALATFGSNCDGLLKLKKLRFHDLRHTHLSQLIADGEAITTIAARAGHSNPHTTLTVYSHLIPNEDQAMMDRFDEKHLFQL
jgi:integrase